MESDDESDVNEDWRRNPKAANSAFSVIGDRGARSSTDRVKGNRQMEARRRIIDQGLHRLNCSSLAETTAGRSGTSGSPPCLGVVSRNAFRCTR
jgi:hypothetical protein